jgi:hypothetical protein
MEEFEELTPGEFQALCKRRNIRIRYERYAHSITASVVANVNRGQDDAVIHPFDFVRDDESARKKEERNKAKRYAKKVIGNLPPTTPQEKMQEIRTKAIADLKASGHSDAEEIFDSCWPSLKPKDS